MNKNSRKSRREIVLLLLPVLALVCWGVWVQSRSAQNQGPFKLVIDEIKVSAPAKSRFRTSESDKRPIEVAVFIGHKGATPAWWGKGMNPSHSRIHFTAAGEKDLHNENVGGSTGVSWDESREQYFIDLFGRIPKDPNFLKHATCHVSIGLESQMPPFAKMAKASASIPMESLKE